MDKDLLQKRLIETFRIEAEEHLRSITYGLLQLEKSTALDERIKIIEILHREAHSLKGAARAVNLLEVELICHTIEKIFFAWKRNELPTTQIQYDVLHETINTLQKYILNSKVTPTLSKDLSSATILRLNNLLKSEVVDSVKTESDAIINNITPSSTQSDLVSLAQTVRIESSKLDSLLLKTEEMLVVKLVMKKYVNEFAQINDSIKIWKNQWQNIIRGKSRQSIEAFMADGFNRIKQLETSLTSLHTEFDLYGRQFTSLIDALLDDAKDMVLLPFSTLLDNLPAMVRNLSREQGKDINLILDGTEIEIDKRILDEIKDPLIHIIRNSIDHGIEKPEQRTEKQPQGTIKLSIMQFNGNEVEIIITDDGKGIDVNAVKASAIKLGTLSQEQSHTMSDQDALSLIYLSGVSTSPIITNVSGQGLGMAIVYEKIEKIGGHIELKSQYHVGTEIKITLPLSLTTFKGVLIRVVDQTYVLPTAHIERIIRITPNDVTTIENKDTIIVDGVSLSLVKLNDILNIPTLSNTKPETLFPVAIIRMGEHSAAFQIDEVYGEQEVLVKKLSNPLVRVKYITAATILENGVAVLILNTSDLIKALTKNLIKTKHHLNDSDSLEETKNILVVEDSITTRMLLKNIIEMAGYNVITAVDGVDALYALKDNTISLVVSDVEMPRMNGFELTKNIRHDEHLEQLPVVLVTTRAAPQDREYGLEAGADAYIVKSNFDDNNLIAVIKRLL